MIPAHPRTQWSCILLSFLHTTRTDWQSLVENWSKLKRMLTWTPKERNYILIRYLSMSTDLRDAAVTSWTYYSIIMLGNKEKTPKINEKSALKMHIGLSILHICPTLMCIMFIMNKIKEFILKTEMSKQILQTLTLHIFNNICLYTFYV